MEIVSKRQDLHIGLHDGRLADVLQRDIPPFGGQLHHGTRVHQAITKLFGESVIRFFWSWHLMVELASTGIGQPARLGQERARG